MATYLETDRLTAIPHGAAKPLQDLDAMIALLADDPANHPGVTPEQRAELGHHARETLRVTVEGLNWRQLATSGGPNPAEQAIPPYSLDGGTPRPYPDFEPYRSTPPTP